MQRRFKKVGFIMGKQQKAMHHITKPLLFKALNRFPIIVSTFYIAKPTFLNRRCTKPFYALTFSTFSLLFNNFPNFFFGKNNFSQLFELSGDTMPPRPPRGPPRGPARARARARARDHEEVAVA